MTEESLRIYKENLRHIGEENYAVALTGLQELRNQYPSFHPVYRKIVEIYFLMNKPNNARIYFENLLKKEAQTPGIYYALARISFQKENFDQSIEYLNKCITIDPYYADAFGPNGGLSEVYQVKGDLNAAEDFYRKFIREHPQNPFGYFGLGRTYLKMYEGDKALEWLNKAIEIDPNLTYAYHSLLFLYETTGRYQKSLESCQKLIEVASRQKDPEMVAYGLSKIGGLYYFLGEYKEAMIFFTRTLNIAVEIGDKRREGIALLNIGAVNAVMGNFEKALQYFNRSLRYLRRTGVIMSEIRTLFNIGLIYKDLKNYPESLKYFDQALQLARDKGFRIEECFILTGIGETYLELKEFTGSLQKYQEALSIAREIKDQAQEGYILSSMGNIYFQMAEYDSAIFHHRRALELGKLTGDKQIIWEAESGLGVSYVKKNQPKIAIRHLAHAVAIFDSIRQDLDLQLLSAGFLNDKYEVYPAIIQALSKLNKVPEAFVYAEKYKAKTALQILSQGQTLLTELLPDSIHYRFVEIRSLIEEKHARQSEVLSSLGKNSKEYLDLDHQITGLELRKSSLIDSVKSNFSSYYQLTSSEPLRAVELQNMILKPGRLLVEYIIGPEKTSVFAINADTLIYRELPQNRESISQLMAEFSPLFKFQDKGVGESYNQVFNPDQADFSVPPAFKLYSELLEPVLSGFEGVSELILIPDDILFYLPFEALVIDTSGVRNRYDFDKASFLIERFAISYASSASVLGIEFRRSVSPPGNILAFGNPSFAARNDSSVLAASGNFRQSLSQFLALPHSEAEVHSIGKLFDPPTEVYIRDQATESVFKKEAPAFRVIHLATHFLADDQEPLYSRLILANQKSGAEDGLLQTFEIFNSRLNADLVVLSACNTALGKLSRGEGLIGINRAFLYAGVPSLVLSLWNVDDETTRLIMELFYKNLQRGYDKNRALSLAKTDFLKQAEAKYKDPFYWAPFVLFGEVEPVEFKKEELQWYLVLIFIFIITGLFLTFQMVRKSKNKIPPSRTSRF